MNILITISEKIIDREIVKTVNARELHTFLEVGRDFTTWIKNRIKTYKFVCAKDYILTFPKTGERQNVSMTEYHLTLDMAKELSMVERNEKGRQARRYFIECEKKLKSQSVDYDSDTRFDDFNYLRQYVLTNYSKIMGIIFGRLLKIDEIEKELDHYKSVTKEAKRILARSVVKAA
ncbi:antA/AntB antirepressor family protein [Bartonella machadoae]|uniref:antA/AntB antirepressor family protein n=1 Tax=Bartonella machadoae TaxID=2893471 RepID=UPI001F4D1608|nr:antA/AntB antirepressor family protein [Bartonella machadoae]UNE53615.1 antA/AntB antirepressor family protein [Bartonella machadoae]